MEMSQQELTGQIQTLFGINSEEVKRIEHYFETKTFKKGEYLQMQGSFHANLSFIKSGLIRMFRIDPNTGKEVTQWLATPGTFVTDISCLLFGSQARWDIQTLTDCEVLYLNKANYVKMGKEVSNWTEIEKLFIGKCFSMLEDRIYAHLSMNTEERYEYFFQTNPTLFNQVPLQYIASMLGMTPETFSRVRKKLSS